MTSALPFDDFRTLLAQLPAGDEAAARACAAQFARAEKPMASLGRLEELAAWLATLERPPAGGQPSAGGDLRRQSRRGAPRRLAAADGSDGARGGTHRRRRRGDQPGLPGL